MECGSEELLCQVLSLITDNEKTATGLAEFLGKIGERADGWLGAVAQLLKDYGQTIVGAVGLTFGIWRWWIYREAILHKRLASYIGDRDRRLKGAREQVLEKLQRPAPGLAFNAPAFIDKELRAVLRERNWDRTALALTVESSADWQLSKAIGRIRDKLLTAESEAACLRQELCTAFSIRGAIAASRSSLQSTVERDISALAHFRGALHLRGHEADLPLLELEAHQLRKLGYVADAVDAYKKIDIYSETLDDPRRRCLVRARSRRYLAEIESTTSRSNAYKMMIAPLEGNQFSPGPIALYQSCTPLTDWELTEKGDMHYFVAYLATLLQFPNAPANQLNEANNAYEEVLRKFERRHWFKRRRARNRAAEGKARVLLAQQTNQYDVAWLGH